eukprot:IDg7915t1
MTSYAAIFDGIGDLVFRKAHGVRRQVRLRRFRALFGLQPNVIARVWVLLSDKVPRNAQPRHLMWALLFLKVYATEHVNRMLTGADEKPFRKWAWCFVKLISGLQLTAPFRSPDLFRKCGRIYFPIRYEKSTVPDERVVADLGYGDEMCVTPSNCGDKKYLHKITRARHETVNGRIKNFFAVSHIFRHHISLHSFCFHGALNLVHLDLLETPLFDIKI